MKTKQFIILISVIAVAAIAFTYHMAHVKGQEEGYLDGRKVSEAKPLIKNQPSDTVKTPILYFDPQSQLINSALAIRISVDTFYFDSIAPKVYNKIPKREAFYYVPVWVAKTDSAGKVINDPKTGKPVPVVSYQLLNKLLLLEDYNKIFK